MSKKPSSFLEFVKHDTRTIWVQEPQLRLYVRKPNTILHSADIEIANMESNRPGGGALTRFLDTYEPDFAFLFENVMNDRLSAYLERRGYRRIKTRTMFYPTLLWSTCSHYTDPEGHREQAWTPPVW